MLCSRCQLLPKKSKNYRKNSIVNQKFYFPPLEIFSAENRRLQDPNDSSGRFKKTTIIYSARQIGVISIFAELLSKIPDFRNCYYHMRFTGRDTDANNQPLCYNLQNISTLKSFDAGKTSFGHGRFELHKFLQGFTQESKSGLVCACGSPSILKNVKTECDKFELRLRVEEI